MTVSASTSPLQFNRPQTVLNSLCGHGPGCYALSGDGERERLACERCGAITDAERGELDAARALIRERFGYEMRFTHFPIVGLCAECAGGSE